MGHPKAPWQQLFSTVSPNFSSRMAASNTETISGFNPLHCPPWLHGSAQLKKDKCVDLHEIDVRVNLRPPVLRVIHMNILRTDIAFSPFCPCWSIVWECLDPAVEFSFFEFWPPGNNLSGIPPQGPNFHGPITGPFLCFCAPVCELSASTTFAL